jgi:hypothetical protein
MDLEKETVQLASKGQVCHSLVEAEGYLREFIRETLRDPDGPMQRHSQEYDLYLPWLQEDVWNAPRPDGHHASLPDLDRLYMDAAWSLVHKGFLRPGARKISSIVNGSDYGRGFSLTHLGHEWVKGD